jgi:hypothetical protein
MQPSFVGGIFADSSGTLHSSHQEVTHTNFDCFFLYLFAANGSSRSVGCTAPLVFLSTVQKSSNVRIEH